MKSTQIGRASALPPSSVPALTAALRLPALQSFQEPLLAALADRTMASGETLNGSPSVPMLSTSI